MSIHNEKLDDIYEKVIRIDERVDLLISFHKDQESRLRALERRSFAAAAGGTAGVGAALYTILNYLGIK